MAETTKRPRPLYEIAFEIKKDWKNPNWEAKPFLDAMATLTSIKDNYMFDSAETVVLMFLSHAGTWRGEKAREIKKELKEMIK